MEVQLTRLGEKLDQLHDADPELKLFGAGSHGYRLKPPISDAELRRFEQAHGIRLPEEYASFLLQLGNGGAGPFYGLQDLATSRIRHVDESSKSAHLYFALSKPFPYSEAWNVAAEIAAVENAIDAAAETGDHALEEALFDKKWALIDLPELDQGRLRLCDYGCGTSISLITNGPDKGVVWTDDRTNTGGLYPTTELGLEEKTGFLDWYETWLDQSLRKVVAGN